MISIIIINYNVTDFLIKCLESIYLLDIKIPFEVLIIDNNSKDQEAVNLKVKKLNKYNLNIHNFLENQGCAKAVNFGIKKSKGSIILLLNPDTYLDTNIVSVLSKYLENYNDIGIVGCKVKNPDGSYQISSKRHFPLIGFSLFKFFRLEKLFSQNIYFRKYNYLDKSENILLEVDSISGSCMMFKRKLIDEIGYFDETFFLYFEDTDFCLRAQMKNYKIIYNPNCYITHYGGESFKNSNINSYYELCSSYYKFYIKYYSEYKNSILVKLCIKYNIRILLFFLSLFNKKIKNE